MGMGETTFFSWFFHHRRRWPIKKKNNRTNIRYQLFLIKIKQKRWEMRYRSQWKYFRFVFVSHWPAINLSYITVSVSVLYLTQDLNLDPMLSKKVCIRSTVRYNARKHTNQFITFLFLGRKLEYIPSGSGYNSRTRRTKETFGTR